MTRFSKRKKNITRRRNNGRLNKTRHHGNKKRRTKKQIGGIIKGVQLRKFVNMMSSISIQDDFKNAIIKMNANDLNAVISAIELGQQQQQQQQTRQTPKQIREQTNFVLNLSILSEEVKKRNDAELERQTALSLESVPVPTKACPNCTLNNDASFENCELCDTELVPTRNDSDAANPTELEVAFDSVVGLTRALDSTTDSKEKAKVQKQLDAAESVYNTAAKKMLCTEDNIENQATKLDGFYDKKKTIDVLNNLCKEPLLDKHVLKFLQTGKTDDNPGFLYVFDPAYIGYKPPISIFKRNIGLDDTFYNSGEIKGTLIGDVSNKCWVISLANMYNVMPVELYNLIYTKVRGVKHNITELNDTIDAVEFMGMFNIPLPNGLIISLVDKSVFNSKNQAAPFYIIEPLNVNTPVIVNFGQGHFQYGKKSSGIIGAIRTFIINNKAHAHNLQNLQNLELNAPIQITPDEINQLKR